MKINKKVIVIISIIIVATALVIYFVIVNRFNASTVTNTGTMPVQSGTQTGTTISSETANKYSTQILTIEQKKYPSIKLMIGRLTQVGNYLRADVGEPNSDNAETILYKVETSGIISKVKTIDLKTIDETGNLNYGKPTNISDADWQKLIHY